MKYHSTRGQAPVLSFDAMVMDGLARDGGLYMPEKFPRLKAGQLDGFKNQSYQAIAFAVLRPFCDETLSDDHLKNIINQAYSRFNHEAITPLKQLDSGLYCLELFHGPTLAFKDIALQFLGQMFEHHLHASRERKMILGATSGDTGSAAIEACKNNPHLTTIILHPHERTSAVQRRQMTTTGAKNVFNIAIRGTFDDCQLLVKTMFADMALRDQAGLTAVNSINWARIVAQIVYYFYACSRIPHQTVNFIVPTGNFGNIFAGYVAKMMGAPIGKLIIATNRNDTLFRFFETGTMKTEAVQPSLSPSMDIQIPSNFERLLYLMVRNDSEKTKALIYNLRRVGSFDLDAKTMQMMHNDFMAFRASDDDTHKAIAAVWQSYGYMIDPHTATGFHALSRLIKEPEQAYVCLGCAHPAKFPEAVERATGVAVEPPVFIKEMMSRPESYDILDNDKNALKQYIQDKIL